MIITFDAYVPDGLGPYLPQSVDFEWPAGSDVTLRGTLRHSDASVFNLAGAYALLMAWKRHDTDEAILVQREATITVQASGLFEVYIKASDVQLGLGPGRYTCDCLFVDSTGPSAKKEQVLRQSRTNITRVIADSSQPVTVPSSQQPLAQGPQGPPGLGIAPTGVQTTAYTAALLQLVRCDPTAGVFQVTLPPASAGAGMVLIKNQSDSGNYVSVAPAGLDTIDGAAAALQVAARETVRLFSDGNSDWMVI